MYRIERIDAAVTVDIRLIQTEGRRTAAPHPVDESYRVQRVKVTVMLEISH